MKEEIKKYYGEILASSADVKSDCCSLDSLADQHIKILNLIDDEILNKYYGCGSPLPPALDGCTVLDLGCGTGRDVYLASKLVGPDGFVIGVDMTEQQLDIAKKHLDSQMAKFGFDKPNVEFKLGDIEHLEALGIENESVDVVISNCVINLAANKERLFNEILRVLKPGGELYFSDIFSDRRVPDDINTDPLMVSECLGGTMYLEDFRRMLAKQGYPDFRLVSVKPVTISSPEVKEKAGDINYYAVTARVFKIDSLEDAQEDYGETVEYHGTLDGSGDAFILDRDNSFIPHVPTYVSGNTADLLRKSRYSKHVEVIGDKSYHYGRFDTVHFAGMKPESKGSCCGSSGNKSCCGK